MGSYPEAERSHKMPLVVEHQRERTRRRNSLLRTGIVPSLYQRSQPQSAYATGTRGEPIALQAKLHDEEVAQHRLRREWLDEH